jgi:hypothetical protein
MITDLDPDLTPNALKKQHVGHFCPPGEHGRVKRLLDIGGPCNYGAPRKGITIIGQRSALT